jgi:hypothetical protein
MTVELATETKTTSWTTVTIPNESAYELADWDTDKLTSYVEALTIVIADLEENDADVEMVQQQKRGLSTFERAIDIQAERYERARDRKQYDDKRTRLGVELISRFPDDIKKNMTADEWGIRYCKSAIVGISAKDEWAHHDGKAQLMAEVSPWRFGITNDYYTTGRYTELKKTGYFSDKAIAKTLEFIELEESRERHDKAAAISKTESVEALVNMGLAPTKDYYDYFQVYGHTVRKGEEREVEIKVEAFLNGTDFSLKLKHLSQDEVNGLMDYLADHITDFKAKALREN